MEKDLINEDMNYLVQTLTDIVKSAPDVIRSSTGRINELEKYLFTWSLMSDKYSHDLYGRILQRMLAVECLDDISAAKKFPIWDDSFREQYEIKRKTVVLPDLCHPDDRASQIIFPETFLMPAYNYHDFCCVEKGDVVFDIGAWIGDTSYIFSERLGGVGHIYAFEPMPQNYRMLAENQNKIPNLSIYNLALGSECGTLNFAFGGENSGASRKSDNGEIEVKVSTVDHFVKENKIEKVDFIKADIEGAECDMLLGAAETIRRFHPKLAICIYHRGQTDHYNVPETILSIRKDYEFYVEAYHDSLAETVLFAQPVSYKPEKNMYPVETVSIVKEMYRIVYDRLWGDYKKIFQYEFRRQMNQYLKCDFKWQMNVNHGKLFLTDNRKVHYKIIFAHNGLDILLVFDGYEQYHDVHKKKIKHILDSFLETHIAYKMIVTKGSTYITKRLPVAVTPDSVACNMAELMKGTFIGLWQAGIVSPECARPLLDTLEWKGFF